MWAHGKWKGRGQITSQALVLGEASSICHPRMNCGRYRFDYQVPLPSPSPLPPQSIGFYCDIIWMPARTRRSRPSRLLYMYSCSVWGFLGGAHCIGLWEWPWMVLGLCPRVCWQCSRSVSPACAVRWTQPGHVKWRAVNCASLVAHIFQLIILQFKFLLHLGVF